MSKKSLLAMIIAVALLVSAVLIIIVGILGWTVYKLAEVRRDKASSADLDRVIDHLNSLSHGVHRSQRRAERRIDKAEGDVRSANEAGVSIQARLDGLAERVEKAVSDADDANATSAAVNDSIAGLSEETKLTAEAVGGSMAKMAKLETDLTMSAAEIGNIRTDLIEIRSLSEAAPDTETYATWTDLEARDLRAKSITLDGSGESGFVDTRDVKAMQYGLKESATGAISGYIKGTEGGMQFVPEGGQVSSLSATLGSSGIRWGSNELKVAADGSLQYCRGSSCGRVAVGDGPVPTPEPDVQILPVRGPQKNSM